LALHSARQQTEPILSDAAYKELSKLVGGEWVGSVGGSAEVHNRFEFAVDGKMIKGNGYVLAGGKTVLRTQPNLGWDPVARQVSYVDFHNHDTVYVGHVTLKDGWMLYDFSQLSDPKRHFTGKSRFTDPNHYEFLLGDELIKMARKPG